MAKSKKTSSKKAGRKSGPSGIKGQSKKVGTKVNTTAATGTFPKAMLKAANERLRKLEKVSKLAEGNLLYQRMKNEMISKPKKEGKIFKTDRTGKGVRFVSESEYKKMTPAEQADYMRRLKGFMGSSWSTASGTKKARKKVSEALKPHDEYRQSSYDTFMSRPEIKENMPDLTFEQYKSLFEAYGKLQDVRGDHFKYDDLTMFLEYVNVDSLAPNQIEEAMSFVKDDNWGELADRGWLQRF